MVEPTYKPTPAQVVLELLKEELDAKFQGYFEGDPILFGQSYLPALVVSTPQTQFDIGPTGFDQLTHTLLIQVVFNKKDEFGRPDNQVTMDRLIDQIVWGRDEETGDYKDGTIMAVLRRNITLGNYTVENISTLRKGVINRSETQMTTEGHIDVILTELQAVSNRT